MLSGCSERARKTSIALVVIVVSVVRVTLAAVAALICVVATVGAPMTAVVPPAVAVAIRIFADDGGHWRTDRGDNADQRGDRGHHRSDNRNDDDGERD